VDAAASEESLWRLESPRILVIATHGQFLKNTPTIHFSFQSKGGSGGRINEDFYESANPLQRNMLVLAGANRPRHRVERHLVSGKLRTAEQLKRLSKVPSATESLQRELGDGFLTAYEVWDMNLQGTELVVLLGCESGLGVTQRGETAPGLQQPIGEGVAGLRQSFRVAGARSLIMSMWEVPEEDSIRQIETFVDGWLSENKPRYQAFHAAQRKALKDARKVRGSGHPFWWGGFIYYGQPDDGA
jgi:CHAT domain-containing protein